MAPHILQVAYYPSLRDIRARMLRAAGYEVTSVSGNQEAMMLDNATMATVNLAVVGFASEHSVREEMVHWLKVRQPNIRVVVLQFSDWEKFPEADAAILAADPHLLMTTIASMLKC
jgi:DNA-binding NtrC family response regulator